jgi:hypothetical protein
VHLLKELVDARSVEHERRRVGKTDGVDDTRPARVALAAEHAVRQRHPAVVADRADHLRNYVDNIHPEPVDAAVQPVTHHGVDRLPHLRVLPIEVGLVGGEHVQVVLAGVVVVGPRRARERRAPVGRLGPR